MPVAKGGGIFVSYRRQESSHLAGRLADHLADRFGEGQVFIDVDTIEPGVDFAEESGSGPGCPPPAARVPNIPLPLRRDTAPLVHALRTCPAHPSRVSAWAGRPGAPKVRPLKFLVEKVVTSSRSSRTICSVDQWSMSGQCVGIRIRWSASCLVSGIDAMVRHRPVSP